MATCKICSTHGVVYSGLWRLGGFKWDLPNLHRTQDITVWSIVGSAGCAESSEIAMMKRARVISEVTMNR